MNNITTFYKDKLNASDFDWLNCFQSEDYTSTNAYIIYECPIEIDLYYPNKSYNSMEELYAYSHDWVHLYVSFVTLIEKTK